MDIHEKQSRCIAIKQFLTIASFLKEIYADRAGSCEQKPLIITTDPAVSGLGRQAGNGLSRCAAGACHHSAASPFLCFDDFIKPRENNFVFTDNRTAANRVNADFIFIAFLTFRVAVKFVVRFFS